MDKIRPLKIENTTDGSQDDQGYPTEVNPSEDYVSCKGISFENSDGHTIDRDVTGELRFIDPVNGTILLSELSKTNHVDGGFANSVYLAVQKLDGGNA